MLVKELIAARHPLIKTAWLLLFERSTYEGAAAIRVTSEVERVELERFGWQLPPVFSVPNAVAAPVSYSIADVSSDILEIVEKRPLILFFGRISWKKGIDRLLEGLLYTFHCKLAIVGIDDENMTPGLRDLAERLGVADRVAFLPRTILGADKEHLLAAADLFVLTSYNENFGNTVVEAMRRGVPVLTTSDVGASEIVRQSGGGWVVEGTPKLIGESINRLLADKALRDSMGLAGENFTREHCSVSGVAQQIDQQLELVLREPVRCP
jgi:glycosyltransferase involved in cell wall biosynthesis